MSTRTIANDIANSNTVNPFDIIEIIDAVLREDLTFLLSVL